MTESEWLTCRNPWVMFSELGEQASNRKLRLFICACCHRLFATISHPPLFMVLMLAEQHIEKGIPLSEVAAARESLRELLQISHESANILGPIAEALDLSLQEAGLFPWNASIGGDLLIESRLEDYPKCDADHERAAQCDLIREIFGNPFRPSVLHPAWHTGTVVSLAQAIYDTGDFTRLPILADALEDAGCTDDAILRHCREPGQHVKGCWVVDLLIGKQ